MRKAAVHLQHLVVDVEGARRGRPVAAPHLQFPVLEVAQVDGDNSMLTHVARCNTQPHLEGK